MLLKYTFYLGYGMTECSMASHFSIFDRRDNYTPVGHIVANAEMKVLPFIGLI